MNARSLFLRDRNRLPHVSAIVPSIPMLGRGHTTMGIAVCKACREGDDKHHRLGIEQLEKVAQVYAR